MVGTIEVSVVKAEDMERNEQAVQYDLNPWGICDLFLTSLVLSRDSCRRTHLSSRVPSLLPHIAGNLVRSPPQPLVLPAPDLDQACSSLALRNNTLTHTIFNRKNVTKRK